jgi:tol-pal system protein YbgF
MRIFCPKAFLVCFTAFAGCAGGQLSKINSDVIRTQEMVQTTRSETRADIEQIEKQIADLNAKIEGIAKLQADLQKSIESYKTELKNLNMVMNKLNQRLQPTMEEMPPPLTPGVTDSLFPKSEPPAAANYGVDQRPEQAYQTAYNDYVRGKYDLAIVEFNEFIKSFSDAELADNAQYWIAECYYAQKRFEDAKHEFEKVMRNYPGGDKIIAATLKLGYCQYEMGDVKAARATLEELVNRFPFSEEARSAEDRLKSMSKTK